jgi:hypothetical protein
VESTAPSQAELVRSSFLPGLRVRTELLEFPQYRAMLIVKQVDSEDAMTFAVPKPVACASPKLGPG